MAEEKAEAAAASVASAAPAAGGGSKLVMILGVVNTVATLGMAGVLFMSFQKEKARQSVQDIAVEGHGDEHGEAKAEDHGGGGGHGGAAPAEAKKKAGEFGKMVTLDQFTVNLSTPGSVGPKFVRVNVSLEVPNDDAEAEVTQKMPQVRNAIIDLFNSKKPADLANAEGRDYLKEEIKNALNGFMVSGKVRGVYFTNFAVTI